MVWVGRRVLSDAEWEQEFDPFAVFRKGFGVIPHILRAQSALPRAMAAHAKLEEAVRFHDGGIARIQKERILLSVAADRRDNYCVALDSGVLSSLGVPEDQIENLLKDYHQAGLSAADQALLEFCLKLSRNASSVHFEDIEAMRTAGFGDERSLKLSPWPRSPSTAAHYPRLWGRSRISSRECFQWRKSRQRTRQHPLLDRPAVDGKENEEVRTCPLPI
jgi:alkylhydroperoxidase family enzyme